MWPFGKKQPAENPADDAPPCEAEQQNISKDDEDHTPPINSRAEMQDARAHRHDVEYQCELVLRMMQNGECVPYAFDRAVTLLRKERRYEEEAIICRYVKDWAAEREAEFTTGTKTWLNPSIQRLIRRLPEVEALWLENPHGDR